MHKKITKIEQIQSGIINWAEIGERVKSFRLDRKISVTEAATALGLSESMFLCIERGMERKTINIIWKLCNTWNISLNWLINGEGHFFDEDPAGLLPKTLIIERGAGIRRSDTRAAAEDGNFTDETFEFVMAIDRFKQINQVSFPSCTQIYEIMLALGYRKSVPARIAPLGYIVKDQKTHEKQQQIKEPVAKIVQFDDPSPPKTLFASSPSGYEFLLASDHFEDFCSEQNLHLNQAYDALSGYTSNCQGWKIKEMEKTCQTK